MKHHRAGDGERILAVFIDFENLALGFAGRRDRFQIEKVLERLVEKGKIVAKKAYCDWSRFGAYAGSLHECAIELIEIPKRSMTGKNSADIRLVVDAVDLAYSKDHIDTFVIVSGDSDFSPLVSKLKELGKHVIGLGLQDATSHLLRDNCDEFIYYEDLDRPPMMPMVENLPLQEGKRKVYALMMESLLALRRENKDTIMSSMVKDTMKRKRPQFNEEYYGYRTFSELLEEAQKLGVLELEKHKTGGSYIVTKFGAELRRPPQMPQLPQPQPMSLQPPRVSPPAASPPQLEDRRDRPPLPPRREDPPPPRPQQRPPEPRPQEPRPQEFRQAEPRPQEPRQQEPRPQDRPEPRHQDRPAQRQPVVVPPRPQPAPPATRQPVPPPQPVRPQPAPPASDEDEDEDEPTLGRNLIEDVDDFDDDADELPTYHHPRKGPEPKPVPKPAAKAGGKPAAKPGGGRAASPPPASTQAPRRQAGSQQQKPRGGKPPEAEPAPARQERQDRPAGKPVSPPPAPKPKPRPADDDGFGSGLDE